MLVDIYFGMFKIKDVHAIKNSMTKLFRTLLEQIAPPLTTFMLTEHDDKITLVIRDIQENQVPQLQFMTPAKSTMDTAGAMDATLEWIEMFSALSNFTIPHNRRRQGQSTS